MNAFNKNVVLDALTLEVIAQSSVLNIVARFWDRERLAAFVACYTSMRMLDDWVDDIKERNNGVVPLIERKVIFDRIDQWLKALDVKEPLDDDQATLIQMMAKYQIPLWPWKSLVTSMYHDVEHNGYQTYADFLLYSEGAAVAPGAIFMHLCGVRQDGAGYLPPQYDILQTARPLALFSYLVHIIRDFQKDQNNGLNYFATDMMEKHNLTAVQLVDMAKAGEVTDDFRKMIGEYYALAGEYWQQSRAMLDETRWGIAPRYILSLEVLFSLYQFVFAKINLTDGNFTVDELTTDPEEMLQCITSTVCEFTV